MLMQNDFTDLEKVFRAEVFDLTDRVKFLQKGPVGRKNVAWPFHKIKAGEVLEELCSRGPPNW